MKAFEIAQTARVPKDFLSKILSELRAADIVSAQRGYYGGYALARAPEDIHLDELLNAVGTRDPFSSLLNGADLPVPFIDDLRIQLQTLAAEAIHRATLADLVAHADTDSRSVLKYDLTGQD